MAKKPAKASAPAEPAVESALQAGPLRTDSIRPDISFPLVDYNAPKRYILNKINVEGVQFLDHDILIASSGMQRGDSVYIPSNYISYAINNLWRQRYFSDVQITGQPVGDSINLTIYLSERPRVYRWDFSGIRKGQKSDLTDNLKLKRGTELSDYVLSKSSEAIRKYFIEKGFLNVEVTPKIANDTVMKNAVNVTFAINKNRKVKIGAVDFEGNHLFSDRKLRSTFKKTNKLDYRFWKNSKLKTKEYEEDKENLIDFYNSKGYRNAMIVSDSIYNIRSNRIGIKVTVDEGNKYYFRNISWVGNSEYETDMLQSMLGIESGDIYDKKTLQKRLGIGKESKPDDYSVSSLYQNNGFLMSGIDPAEIIIGQDSIDLEVRIFEGKPFTINDVSISGNQRVNDEVVRRELYTRPGDLYNRSLIMNTIRQLGQMGHFNPETLMPGIHPVTNELVDIAWPLEEKASDQFEISGGWGAGMFVGSVGITLNNLSLSNFFKKGAWRPYPHGQSQQLSIRAQSNGSYYKAFSASFTEPWLNGKKPNSLTVGAHYSDETDAYYMWQVGNKHFRTMGLSVGLGRRLNWPDPLFTLYNEISYEAYSLKDWTYFIITNGTSNIFALRTVFGRNSVDQPIYPRTGSDISISLALTPPYSLFDKKDYADTKMSDNDRYRWIEYHKWILKAQWYSPISTNNKLVLMTRAEMGYLGSYNKHKLSPFEGFNVGGDGMSGYNVYGVDVIGLRGYENGSLTPQSETNDYARVYNKYTVELRYPFMLQPSSTIYGLLFGEAGNGYASWKNFNPFEVKRALGLGVRIYLPMIGMIGVDWGYGFDIAPGDTKRNGGKFSFMIGQQF